MIYSKKPTCIKCFCAIALFTVLLCGCKKDEPKKEEPVQQKLILSVNSIPLQESGTTAQLTISATSAWTLSLTDSKAVPSWFTTSAQSGSAGTTSITIKATENNENYDDRNAYIKVVMGSQTQYVTVTQKKKDAILLTQDRMDVSQDGGTIQVSLQSNVDYTVTIPTEYAKWISKTKTKGLSSHTESFAISKGSVEGPREGIIIFTSGKLADTLHVFQAVRDLLIIESDTLSVPATGAVKEITLQTNREYDVTISPSDWLRLVSSKASRVDKLFVEVDPHTEYNNRVAYLYVSDKNSNLKDSLCIIQQQASSLVTRADSLHASFCADTLSFTLETNIDYDIVPDESASWISIIPETSTKALDTLSRSIAVEMNPYASSRGANIYLINKELQLSDTLYVYQDAFASDFLSQTAGGFYPLDEKWQVIPLKGEQYVPAYWQWAAQKSKTEYSYRIQSLSQNKVVQWTIPLIGGQIPNVKTLIVTINSFGIEPQIQETTKLNVIVSNDQYFWFLDTKSRTGYIINR